METEEKDKQANKTPWPFLAGLIFFGGLLLFLGFWWNPLPSENTSQKQVIAQAFREAGNAWVLDPHSEKTSLEKRQPIGNLDSVETGPDGQVLLEFENGAAVTLLTEALVTIESEPGPDDPVTTLLLKRGDLRIEKSSPNQSLWIGKNGERILAENYSGSGLQKQEYQINVLSDDATPVGKPVENSLSEDEILGTLERYKSNFFKCYTSVLQRDPSAKGKVNLSFTIENSGKLSTAEVTHSEIQENEFKNCLLEALKRVSFRSFEGVSISTVFPLQFE